MPKVAGEPDRHSRERVPDMARHWLEIHAFQVIAHEFPFFRG
ncbi:hypothetical protein H4684_001099 [Desulfomicrobium macestii]|uniref:Uncharacterized protein n=1 Tax=Desulfomicrobium macestii TaxID=90731 RepID=A0ABR9H190_9BACT|nr:MULTISPECIES: hypothetical protein [Desulfomicrobium]MBE1424467.1 hypothetical protein [Desulfomicrobium macestii]